MVLALRARGIFQLDQQIETTQVGSIQRLDAVAEPETRQRVFFEHAIEPALMALYSSRGRLLCENIFDLINRTIACCRCRTLMAIRRALMRWVRCTGSPSSSLCRPPRRGSHRRALGQNTAQLGLAGTRRAMDQHIDARAPCIERLAQIAFGNDERFAQVGIVLEQLQLCRRVCSGSCAATVQARCHGENAADRGVQGCSLPGDPSGRYAPMPWV